MVELLSECHVVMATLHDDGVYTYTVTQSLLHDTLLSGACGGTVSLDR